MTEHFSDFDASRAGEALGTTPRDLRDVAYGDGQALDVGDAVLEVFPGAGVTRVTTPDARLELFRVPGYTVGTERVVFEQGADESRSRLHVRADGRVAFHPVLRPSEQQQADDSPSGGRQDSTPTQQAPEGATAAQESQEVPVEKLTGRLGRDPWLTTQDDQPLAGFPLAVNDDRGKTTWHRVVAFGEVADQVKTGLDAGQIKKGRLVEVSGSTVVHQEPTAKGGVRTTTEFHATSIQQMASPPGRGRRSR